MTLDENSPSPPPQAVDAAPRAAQRLPTRVPACLFDLMGVLTGTAKLHAAAWKEMFDGFLTARAEKTNSAFVALWEVGDYTYADSKSRADGTRSLLQSRGLELPTGAPNDSAGQLTVGGPGNATNADFLRRIRDHEVKACPGSVRHVHPVRSSGLHAAVVSAHRHLPAGPRRRRPHVAEQQLAAQPTPDNYLAATNTPGAEPGDTTVFQNALPAVAAA